MPKIIATGPESSGKTTLCKNISEYFKISYSKEYAREYLKKIGANYVQEDLLKIAQQQLTSEQGSTLLDTDLITIKIWSNYKYGNCDEWILEQIQKQKSEERFYLLCKPDIVWEKDPLRENPKNRTTIFRLYKKEIEQLNHKYHIVEGENRVRDAISKILTQNSTI